MASHKQNIKQVLHSATQTKNLNVRWADEYDQLYQPRKMNLYKVHKVPRIRINQPRYW